MTKQFTSLQLFSLTDGRLSTGIDDVYTMLNHICDENLMTHHLPTAFAYLKLKCPDWFREQRKVLNRIEVCSPFYKSRKIKKSPEQFEYMMNILKSNEYSNKVDVPQLKDEFDTSDFGGYMIDNSLLLKKLKEITDVIELMRSSKDSNEWNENCKIVKLKFGGDYPNFWYREIIESGLMDETLGVGSSEIKMLSGEEALKAMGIFPNKD